MRTSRGPAVLWAVAAAILLLMPGSSFPDSGLAEPLETAAELGAHFVLFFGLAYLAGRGYAGAGTPGGRRSRVLAAILAYCVLLEILQIAIPGRSFELRDIAVGSLGVLFGFKRRL